MRGRIVGPERRSPSADSRQHAAGAADLLATATPRAADLIRWDPTTAGMPAPDPRTMELGICRERVMWAAAASVAGSKRVKVSLWMFMGIGAALWADDPAYAAIIDTGDIFLSGNDLLIGNTADGSRTVDADTDGPYDSVTLGISEGVTGTLLLDNGSSFATTGGLAAGIEGDAILTLTNGCSTQPGLRWLECPSNL